MIKKSLLGTLLFLIMLTTASTQEDFVSKDLDQTRQVKSCFLSLNYFLTFIAEIVKYEGSSDEQSLKVVCSECKDKRGSIEFLSSLVGTILKESFNKGKFEMLQPYVEKTLILIRERNVSELNKLAVQVGNLLPIICHECKKSTWRLDYQLLSNVKNDSIVVDAQKSVQE